MKLLIVTQAVDRNDPVLGFFHAWLSEFAKNTEHVTVFALRVGEYELPKNVAVILLRGPRGNRVKTTFKFLYEVWVRRDSYDAVFVHMNPEYVLLGGPLWQALGKSVSLWYTHKHVGFRLRIAEWFVDNIFTASRESFRLNSEKVHVMGHGIAMPLVAHISKNSLATRVLTVGRIAPAKCIREMVDAVEFAHVRGNNYELTIVGAPATSLDSAYERKLKERIEASPIKDYIHLLGPVTYNELPEVLAKADVFLNLSRTGSLDKAVLEAMAAGIVPVTSNEAFRPLLESYGTYIKASDPEAVIDAIERARHIDPAPLVTYVREEHSLLRLIPAIVKIIMS